MTKPKMRLLVVLLYGFFVCFLLFFMLVVPLLLGRGNGVGLFLQNLLLELGNIWKDVGGGARRPRAYHNGKHQYSPGVMVPLLLCTVVCCFFLWPLGTIIAGGSSGGGVVAYGNQPFSTAEEEEQVEMQASDKASLSQQLENVGRLLTLERNYNQQLVTMLIDKQGQVTQGSLLAQKLQKELDDAKELYYWSLNEMKKHVQTYTSHAWEETTQLYEAAKNNVEGSKDLQEKMDVLVRWKSEGMKELQEIREQNDQLKKENNAMRERLKQIYGEEYKLENSVKAEEKEKERDVRGVIVWLGCRYNSLRWSEFMGSFISMERNFNRHYRYPIIIFHEGDYTPEVQQILTSNSSAKVEFHELDLTSIPSIYKHIAYEGSHLITAYPAYKNMCRFFSGQFFWHPATQKYTHYWRMDTDAFLLKPVGFDVFKFMANNGFTYGWHTLQIDLEEVTTRLGETVLNFIKENPDIVPQDLDRYYKSGVYTRESYLNNFEVSSFELWRSPQYKRFYDYLEKSEGFWRYRWGDAPVHSLAVGTFVDPKQIHRFEEVLYQHRLSDHHRTQNKLNEFSD